jgi:tetratricopeptide (TPR) repeat protein
MKISARPLLSLSTLFSPGTVHWLAVLMVALSLLAPATTSAQISSDTAARRLLQEGRHEEALSFIEGELQQRPRDGQLLLLKGAALSSANRSDEAIKVFRFMISNKIEEASAYNNLAVIYAGRGEYETARTSLEWAVRSKPDYVTAHHNLGNVYANLASQAYKQALQLDRGDRTLPAKLAQLGEVLGQTAEVRVLNPAAPTPDKMDLSVKAAPPVNDARSTVADANRWLNDGS